LRTFVDTSAWVAIVDDSDRYHSEAKSHYLQLLKGKTNLLTSNYVLTETYTWLRYHASHRYAVRFHKMVTSAEKLRTLEILWVDRALADAAWEIFERYSHQLLSFTDCTSFVLARRVKVKEVFAFDEDFTVMGFVMRP
jgi:predicted nucleic acid-binding protein